MQINPGADLIECQIVSRPLHLPLLREGDSAANCGMRLARAAESRNFAAQAERSIVDSLDAQAV